MHEEKNVNLPEQKSKIRERIVSANDEEAIPVTITLYAKTWRRLLELQRYRWEKGNRKCRSISGTIWDMTDRSFLGLVNALRVSEKEKKEKSDSPLFAEHEPWAKD